IMVHGTVKIEESFEIHLRCYYCSVMQFKVGDTLGRYRIDVLLGTGGMGAVYRAHDTRLERSVAIKVLSQQNDTVRIAGDLLREVQSACALYHPNVCTIYEVGEEGEALFIAMEYVEGCTLDALIANRPLAISSAVDYAFQIVDALDHVATLCS